MRDRLLIFIALLSLTSVQCTTRVDLSQPVIAMYKYYREKGVSGVDTARLIYYNARVETSARIPMTGQHVKAHFRLSPDTLHTLLRHADSIGFFDRAADHRFEPWPSRRLSLDTQEPKSVLPEYMIVLYQSEEKRHAVSIHPDSPQDLRAFGARIISALNAK